MKFDVSAVEGLQWNRSWFFCKYWTTCSTCVAFCAATEPHCIAALMLHFCSTYVALMSHLCCTYATFCAAAGHHKCDIDPQSNLHFAQKLIPLQPSWNIVFKIYTKMKRCLCEGLLNFCLNPHSSGRWVKALIGQIKYDINIFKIPTILDLYPIWRIFSKYQTF